MKLYDLQKQFMQQLQTAPADPRLKIYYDSSLGARLKALKNVFPACERIVGEQFFLQMITEFLENEASTYLTVDAQGQQLAKFIAKYVPACSVPYLSDLANLEWLWYQVFHGPNNPRNTYNLYQNAASDKVLVRRVPGSQGIQSQYPLLQIWEMCQPQYQGDFVLSDCSSTQLLLLQQQHQIYIINLTHFEWELWQRLIAPCRLDELEQYFRGVTSLMPGLLNLLQQNAIEVIYLF